MPRELTGLWLLALLAGWGHGRALGLPWGAPKSACASVPATQPPALYSFEVVGEAPHDPTAFLQGLVYDVRCFDNKTDCKDVFWESTGMYGESDVRLVDADTGLVERRQRMEPRWFGEGLVRDGDRLYQLVWRSGDGFVYSTRDLTRLGTFKTPLSDGWGAAMDGRLVVLSDGSSALTWADPAAGWAKVKAVAVRDGDKRVGFLNELEMIDGEVWANIWQTECIARICPATGRVVGWVLMHGLREALLRRNLPMNGKHLDVLNGIAWDPTRRRLFISGKYWPRIFEVVPKRLAGAEADRARTLLRTCYVDGR